MKTLLLLRLAASACVAALVATGCADLGGRETGMSVVAGNRWSKRMEERRVAMERATRGTTVEVTRTADNQLKLSVPNDVAFDTHRFAVKAQLRNLLDPFAASLADDPTARLSIVGHTDSTGSAAINASLSLERAQSVRDYLAARGVSPTRVQTAGRGEREPIADNASEAGRARNRRLQIHLREPA